MYAKIYDDDLHSKTQSKHKEQQSKKLIVVLHYYNTDSYSISTLCTDAHV